MEMIPICQRIMKKGAGLFVLLLIFFLLTGDLSAETIGVILSGDIRHYREIHDSFLSKLKRAGYSERVDIILQRPYPDYLSLSNAARKLSAYDVDMFITYGAASTQAVLDLKTKTPVIYSSLSEPYAMKLSGKNVTGVSYRVYPSTLLRYLREIVTIRTIGIVYNSGDPDSVIQMEDIKKASEQYGFRVAAVSLKTVKDARNIFYGQNPDAIFITQTPVAEMALPVILEYARAHRIPTASLFPGDYGYHPTISLYARPKELGEKMAEVVIRILDGSNPDKVKVSCCNEVELVFNLKEVKEMGYRIPMDLVATATRLIQ